MSEQDHLETVWERARSCYLKAWEDFYTHYEFQYCKFNLQSINLVWLDELQVDSEVDSLLSAPASIPDPVVFPSEAPGPKHLLTDYNTEQRSGYELEIDEIFVGQSDTDHGRPVHYRSIDACRAYEACAASSSVVTLSIFREQNVTFLPHADNPDITMDDLGKGKNTWLAHFGRDSFEWQGNSFMDPDSMFSLPR